MSSNGISTWEHTAGIVCLVPTGFAAYSVPAFELEGIANEPGVRETT